MCIAVESTQKKAFIDHKYKDRQLSMFTYTSSNRFHIILRLRKCQSNDIHHSLITILSFVETTIVSSFITLITNCLPPTVGITSHSLYITHQTTELKSTEAVTSIPFNSTQRDNIMKQPRLISHQIANQSCIIQHKFHQKNTKQQITKRQSRTGYKPQIHGIQGGGPITRAAVDNKRLMKTMKSHWSVVQINTTIKLFRETQGRRACGIERANGAAQRG